MGLQTKIFSTKHAECQNLLKGGIKNNFLLQQQGKKSHPKLRNYTSTGVSRGGGGERDTTVSLPSPIHTTLQAHRIKLIMIYLMSFFLSYSNYLLNTQILDQRNSQLFSEKRNDASASLLGSGSGAGTGSGSEPGSESGPGVGTGSESGSKLYNRIFERKIYLQMSVGKNFFHSEEHRYKKRLYNRRKTGFISGSGRNWGSGTLIKKNHFQTRTYRYGERLQNRRKTGFFAGSSGHRGFGTLIKKRISFQTKAYRKGKRHHNRTKISFISGSSEHRGFGTWIKKNYFQTKAYRHWKRYHYRTKTSFFLGSSGHQRWAQNRYFVNSYL
jgi:hypothetical protein